MVQTADGDGSRQRVPSLFGRDVDSPASGGSWTAEENKYLLEYKKKGWSWTKISHELFGGHRTDNACKAQHRRLNQITPRTDRSA